MNRPDITALENLIVSAEAKVSGAQDDLSQAAARLASIVGPLATAHRLAELALEMVELAKQEEEG